MKNHIAIMLFAFALTGCEGEEGAGRLVSQSRYEGWYVGQGLASGGGLEKDEWVAARESGEVLGLTRDRSKIRDRLARFVPEGFEIALDEDHAFLLVRDGQYFASVELQPTTKTIRTLGSVSAVEIGENARWVTTLLNENFSLLLVDHESGEEIKEPIIMMWSEDELMSISSLTAYGEYVPLSLRQISDRYVLREISDSGKMRYFAYDDDHAKIDIPSLSGGSHRED